MPLLHKKPFTPNEFPLDLREDEEVFFCKLTREIFRDYDEFCERIILCNSLVWSCSLTGRSHLTYQEAMASEEKVKKLLKSFPMELRIPVLYLASLCERKSLVDLAEDVYSFAKDRYFIGETVVVSLPDGALGPCHILAVIPPTQKELEEYEADNTKNGENRYWPPACLYKYEVETMDDGKELTVNAEHIFRKKSAYNKDKNRLYIKQFVHLESGFWKLKESSNTKYGISKVKFDQIFCGDPPDMGRKNNSPLKKKPVEKGKRQETLNKYFKQASGKQYMSPRKSPKKGDIRGNRLPGKFDKQRKRRRTKKEMEEYRNRLGKELVDSKRRARAVKKEERLKRAEVQREWNRKRDDLECEDLKELPVPHLVETKVPIEYFGDIIMIMEFLKAFEKILNVKDFFPHGVSFDIIERALVEQEVAGPLSDLLQLFLAGIFDLQDQEADEIRETDVKITPIFERGDANTMKLLRQATATEAWIKQYHAAPLSQLVLDTSTLSEILRLHLLSSGSRKKDKCTKWRYQARGGYCSNDDPAITLKLNEPHIIQHLSQASFCDLDIGDKVTLLNCLMNQILTYSAARDIIEEGCEKARQCRIELRSLNAAETKREKEEALRQKEQRKKEDVGEEDGDVNGRSLRSTAPETNKEMIRLAKEMSAALSKTQLLPLGMDRAFRRFWIFPSLPGLFVENHSEENVGLCLPKGTPHFNGNVIEDGVAYIRRIFEEGGDKENFSEEKLHNHQMNSPSKKLLTEKNGADSPVGTAVLRTRVKSDSVNMQPLTCWGDPNVCPVHSEMARRISWAFFKEEAEINILIESLNRRGIRERRLRQALIKEKENIFKSLPLCPVEKLNSTLVEKNSQVELRPKGNNKAMKIYDNANLNHPAGTLPEIVIEQSLRDLILETEEKISLGALGVLKVTDRKAWRLAIQNHGYDKLCKKLTWGGKFSANSQGLFDDSLKKEEDDLFKKDPDGDSRSSSPSLELNLQGTLGNELEPVTQRPVILDLASAILQIEQCIEHKYLKRPLGLDPKERDKGELKMPTPALERWEAALMESTTFPQLFLHLSTFDNSVMWARSALNAFCKICRGSNDPENMLLCDTCNKGHHLYCLKPKLTKVPSGDWHCPRCQPKEKVKTVKKKRQLFCDGSDEESESVEPDAICKVCSDNGAELFCVTCDRKFHLKCVVPPVRKVPKSKWFCHECRLQNSLNQVKSEPKVEVKQEPKKEPEPEKERDWRAVERVSLSPGEVERSSRRRCSKAATAKISHFAKQLRSISWEGEEERSENRPGLRESSRRRTRRTQEPADLVQDLPLDNAALQEILDEIMHHKDAWPFLRPVTKTEVPDYHLYIKRPMDFGTIKHKLNMLEYRKNSELFADAELLFNNCYKYNEEGSEVYRAGEKLEKLFEKLCKERNLMASDDDTAPPTSKRSRTVL